MRRVGYVVLLAWIGCASVAQAEHFTNSEHELRQVVELASQRLALMPWVARWKHAHALPVRDRAREQRVLDATVERAQALGMDPAPARRLFELQIDLACRIQEHLIERWRRSGAPATALRDLESDLRPELDRIGAELMVATYLALPELERGDFATRHASLAARLRAPGLGEGDATALLAAFGALRRVPSKVLARVAQSKVLRIGTTGDYAPFSLERDGVLTGTDIDIGVELARALGAQARFVRTSWPDLMEDFRAGRFDIALGGISVTAEREAVAAFSLPHHHGGKAAIARCSERERFDTLAEIDRPQTRLVVNPGGTNERFARDRLPRASLRVHPDNRTIFDELIAGRADVMVTDDIEVALQAARHPELCRAGRRLFTHADKALLLPREDDLVSAVNAWLRPRIASGELARRLRAALRAAP